MMNRKKTIISALLLAGAMTAGAQVNDSTALGNEASEHNPHTTVKRERVFPLVTTKIKLLTRTYGDSIVLRWAAEDYVSWKYLADYGVNVLRVAHDGRQGLNIDTLAYALKPLSLEQFRAKYPPTDSLAMVPQGVLYGDAENRHSEPEGTMGRTLEDNADQDISYGFAMLVAEWRKDLAEDMAVRLTDRNVKPGMTYDYYVQPTVWENNGRLIFEPGVAEEVVNNPYTPKAFDPVVVDSLSNPMTLTLGWWDHEYSSYEVERRMVSTLKGEPVSQDWQRVTPKPYVSMVEQPEGEDYRLIGDSVPELGIYEYRILGYDAFADLSAPTQNHRIVVRDVAAPSAPVLKRIVLERPVDDDPMAKVIAHIIWEKDGLEDDLVGYCINYASARSTGGEWVLLNDDMIAPQDTMFSVDMTGKSTGMVYISAFDDSGNQSRSFIQQIELRDYKVPDMPDSLTATIQMPKADSLQALNRKWAYVILKWQPCADNDIDYYDIAFANDTTHTFIIRNQGGIRETWFLDSLALDVNQKYIYYQVRAVDYSTNIGPWSPWIQVTRPHVTPPTVPHLERSTSKDEEGIHMEWVIGTDADMEYHQAYRRLGEDGEWELIGRYDHDSLKAHNYTIVINDRPTYDRQQRYYYYVESFNSSPFTSKSLAVSFLYQGPKIWDVSLNLSGAYDEKNHQTRLVWDTGKLPFDAPYYYCVYRRGEGKKRFDYMGNVPADTQEFVDQRLQKGEQAEYYVQIQWRDGRQSTLSNTVKVHRSAE